MLVGRASHFHHIPSRDDAAAVGDRSGELHTGILTPEPA